MAITTIDIGNMEADQAEIVREKLTGKTYMNFQVCCGIHPGGRDVSVSTEHDGTREEIVEMLMYIMACEM